MDCVGCCWWIVHLVIKQIIYFKHLQRINQQKSISNFVKVTQLSTQKQFILPSNEKVALATTV